MNAPPSRRGSPRRTALIATHEDRLELGPVTSAWLASIKIKTRAQLARMGSLNVYSLLKANGHNVTLNLVYALEAALRDCHWTDLPDETKASLRAAVASRAKPRCDWAGNDALYQRYHDEEWGVPLHDDRRLFEFLILEGAQAGLSWITILRKREAYRAAFAEFDPAAVAAFRSKDIARLLENPGIVRNRLKVESARSNAQAYLDVQAEFGSFDHYLWRFVDGVPIQNTWSSMKQVPARTELSDKLSADLKRRGFRFVGSTICYAHMQAVGMVNDHLVHCFRHREVHRAAKRRV